MKKWHYILIGIIILVLAITLWANTQPKYKKCINEDTQVGENCQYTTTIQQLPCKYKGTPNIKDSEVTCTYPPQGFLSSTLIWTVIILIGLTLLIITIFYIIKNLQTNKIETKEIIPPDEAIQILKNRLAKEHRIQE